MRNISTQYHDAYTQHPVQPDEFIVYKAPRIRWELFPLAIVGLLALELILLPIGLIGWLWLKCAPVFDRFQGSRS